MDKEYVLFKLRERISILKERFRLINHLKDEWGNDVNKYTAATKRTLYKQDLNLCLLIEELIVASPGQLCILSDEATEGLERLMEPLERHRRLKDE